jgi:hypothetical protein
MQPGPASSPRAPVRRRPGGPRASGKRIASTSQACAHGPSPRVPLELAVTCYCWVLGSRGESGLNARRDQKITN